MSKRLDKTNSENVQSIAQIGMTKRKCPLEWTKQILKMSTRMDKTNSENVHSNGQNKF